MDILGFLRGLGRRRPYGLAIRPSNHQTIKSSNGHPRARRGSALLIVLGMLAFMIVSAVAFAAYMRYSRMPSSYLRRSSASRLLVKAALARAIDEIDASIGNNPYPGIGITQTRYPRNQDSSKGAVGQLRQRNIWLHRVFFGSIHDSGGSVRTEILDDPDGIKDETVSPLTLEALAYIPPPLVNEARYFSRRSPAAEWKSLGFDAGRYAFCALDVSDYFDINRLTAAAPRSSAGNRRISLGYVFENDKHTQPGGSKAEGWDKWMEKFREIDEDTGEFDWSGTTAPLISLADFNLALEDTGGIGDIKSPFCEFLKSGNSKNSFYTASKQADLDRINGMTFVTDGYFPQEKNDDSKLLELADPKNQPFKLNPSGGKPPSSFNLFMGTVHQNDKDTDWSWHRRLGGVGLAALYDYLDEDHVPVTLAAPTMERVPMICGIEPMLNSAKLKVNKVFEYPDNNGEHGDQDPTQLGAQGATRTCKQIVHYRLDPTLLGLMSGAIKGVYVFPFNKPVDYSASFKVDGRVSFFFSTEKMGLRTNNPSDVLHMASDGSVTSGVDANGLMNVALTANLKANPKERRETEEKAVEQADCYFMAGGAPNLMQALTTSASLLDVEYTWTQTCSTQYGQTGGVNSLGWGPTFSDALAGQAWDAEPVYSTQLCIVNGSGARQAGQAAGDAKNILNKDLYFNMAVWLRVMEGKDVVDMVPACLGDDTIQNPSSGGGPGAMGGVDLDTGKFYPLMRFDTAGSADQNATIKLSVAELDKLVSGETQPSEITFWPKAAIVADPRFNHAPENWFAIDSSLSADTWLKENHSTDNGCDGDIFMEVSDNAYLQSKYELAMLPACATLRTTGQPTTQGAMKLFTTYGKNYIPSSFNNTVQGDYMWRTYDPIGDHASEFDEIKWIGDAKGYRVCPYSDSTNVIMSVLANTPLNWACAGTNECGFSDTEIFNMSDPTKPKGSDFNKKYAWNEYSDGGRFVYSDLEAIAGNFIEAVRTDDDVDWEKAWDDLGWYDSDNNFCGVRLSSETDDLWNVDRKFFYGYWKECFAARQQLFLVFVRAEPVMMGGGGMGQIPPQLGARAVALVWRNSTATPVDSNTKCPEPHQTRVLFYRQLD